MKSWSNQSQFNESAGGETQRVKVRWKRGEESEERGESSVECQSESPTCEQIEREGEREERVPAVLARGDRGS